MLVGPPNNESDRSAKNQIPKNVNRENFIYSFFLNERPGDRDNPPDPVMTNNVTNLFSGRGDSRGPVVAFSPEGELYGFAYEYKSYPAHIARHQKALKQRENKKKIEMEGGTATTGELIDWPVLNMYKYVGQLEEVNI